MNQIRLENLPAWGLKTIPLLVVKVQNCELLIMPQGDLPHTLLGK